MRRDLERAKIKRAGRDEVELALQSLQDDLFELFDNASNDETSQPVEQSLQKKGYLPEQIAEFLRNPVLK